MRTLWLLIRTGAGSGLAFVAMGTMWWTLYSYPAVVFLIAPILLLGFTRLARLRRGRAVRGKGIALGRAHGE